MYLKTSDGCGIINNRFITERTCQMDLIYEIKNSLLTILPPSIFDILDIALLAVLIFYILKFMRQNRAGGLFKGLIVIVVAYLAAKLVHMKALAYILENAFSIGLIALVILFQPELRRSLENMGQSRLMDFAKGSSKPNNWEKPIKEICKACRYFAENSVGALIVIERNEKLGEQIKTGTAFKAEINTLLLENLFFINSPLHDGAVIIQDGEIAAAGCMLPTTSRPELVDKALGSRHKAALGMSENSDAIVIVVSEETGIISVAENRSFYRQLSVETLENMLTERLMPELKNNKDSKAETEENSKQAPAVAASKKIPRSKTSAAAEVSLGSGKKASLTVDKKTGELKVIISKEIGVIPAVEIPEINGNISEEALISLLNGQVSEADESNDSSGPVSEGSASADNVSDEKPSPVSDDTGEGKEGA